MKKDGEREKKLRLEKKKRVKKNEEKLMGESKLMMKNVHRAGVLLDAEDKKRAAF